MNPLVAALRGAGYLSRRTFSPRLVRNRLAGTLAYWRGRETTAGFPTKIHVEATNLCNLDCVMCPRQVMKRPVGRMDAAVFERVVAELRGRVEFVYLHLFGESLLHPDLFRMIRLAREAGLATGLATNATVLTQEKARALTQSGLDFLVISFDGADRETYESIRRHASFEKTLANIDAFLRIRRPGAPHTAIQIICMKGTEGKIGEYLGFWRGRRVESIRVKPLQTWSGEVGGINALVLPEAGAARPGRCDRLWRHLAIHWDGTVVPCEFDYDAAAPLGNIRDRSLAEIWNGPEIREMRRRHAAGERAEVPLCRSCNYRGPSRLEDLAIVALDTLTTTKLISLLGR